MLSIKKLILLLLYNKHKQIFRNYYLQRNVKITTD